MNKMNFIKYFFIVFNLLIFSFCNNAYAEDNTENPIVQGPFKTALFPEGQILFKKTQDEEYPVYFILKYKENNQIVEKVIDKYSLEGGYEPQVISVFFYPIHQQPYIFVLIKQDMNHPGLQTYGEDYNIYAYTKNRQGQLRKDKNLSNDPNFSGVEGYIEGEPQHYKYKNATLIKRYLKNKYP